MFFLPMLDSCRFPQSYGQFVYSELTGNWSFIQPLYAVSISPTKWYKRRWIDRIKSWNSDLKNSSSRETVALYPTHSIVDNETSKQLTNFLILSRQIAFCFVMTKWNPKWAMKNSFVLIMSEVAQPYYGLGGNYKFNF